MNVQRSHIKPWNQRKWWCKNSVQEYIYLDLDHEKEIKTRIGMGWSAFGK